MTLINVYRPLIKMMSTQTIQTVTLGLTGASGMPYGIRLLECLLRLDKTVWLVYSQAAQIVA